ncbi:hypothetical protein DOY81_002610 [Sarcophaga bullata]|nr:hypothetical protein DOY81_002610 [Sarcophaga bullata]
MEVTVGLCRLCASLRKADVLTTIKDESNETCEKLRHCCQLDIKIKDVLPKSICQECLNNLNISYKFYLKVKEAQETLQALYPSSALEKETEEVMEESHSGTVVTDSTVATKKPKSKLITDAQVNDKDTIEPTIKKSKSEQRIVPVKTIKLEKVVSRKTLYSSEEFSQQNYSPAKKDTSETYNYLEEVYNMLDMTKEEVALDNSYEILETIENGNDTNVTVADIESEAIQYSNNENDDEQRQFVETSNDILEEDCNEALEDPVDIKESLVVSGTDSKELNLELEYIEDEDYDDEISSSRDDRNKLNDIKAPLFLPPELQFKSWKSYHYLCFLCDLKTISFLDLKQHIATEHNITESDKLQYKCYDCQKTIPRYNYFLNHIRSKHHPALKLKCEACDLSCQTYEELSQHRSVNCAEAKHYETLLPCNHCFKSFYNNFGLQYHCKSQHTTPKLHVKYQCLHCSKQFQNKNTFKAHERLHTDGNIFVCDICQRAFSSKLSLEQHQNVHVTDKLYKCNICSKSFKTFVTLDQHQSIHNNEKPFKCEYCGKNFRKKIEKTTHERMHTGEMPFECDQCDKRFRFRSAFYAHLKCHSGVKPYACGYCDKTFADSSNRNKHVRRIHFSGESKLNKTN